MKARLYFLHIPKTGGTSFAAGLDAVYSDDQRFPGNMIDQLLAAHPEEVRRYQYFRGHFGWFLPDLVGLPLLVVTLLRDPIERAISYYNFAQRVPEFLSPPDGIKGRSLGEVLNDPIASRMFSNLQARYLAWHPTLQDLQRSAPRMSRFPGLSAFELADLAAHGLPDRALLAAARDGLAHCATVGVTSRMKDLADRVSQLIGRRIQLPVDPLNASPTPAATGELESHVRKKLEALNDVDLVLYADAERLAST